MAGKLFTLIETPTFTRLAKASFSDEEYRALQLELARNPQTGDVIPGSGGIRKLRWAAGGRGKSGGFRIIYYWAAAMHTILMLYMYPKNVTDDLSKAQIHSLAKIVKEEYK